MARYKFNNRHHLLFCGKDWNKGSAKKLRAAFVRRIPVYLHEELHQKVKCVPVPKDNHRLDAAYKFYLQNKAYVDGLGPIESLKWLIMLIDDGSYRKALREQLRFLDNRRDEL